MTSRIASNPSSAAAYTSQPPTVTSERQHRAPVMMDVARLAGVSHQTVSRVLNGDPRVRPETCERVLLAVEQLNYRRNRAAQVLASRRSGVLAIAVPAEPVDTTLRLVHAVEAAGREAGLATGLVRVPASEADGLRELADCIRDLAAEVVVLADSTGPLTACELAAVLSLPVISLMDGRIYRERGTERSENLASEAGAAASDRAAARAAVQHLIDLGHTSVLHLAGPLTWVEAQARLDGYQAAMRSAGLRPLPPVEGDWSAASGWSLGRDVARSRAVTAVSCANDQMALGLIRALTEAGRPVPEDVSVVGIGDIPEAPYLRPPLTTVRQDAAALGAQIVATAQTVLDGAQAENTRPVGELAVRRSTTRLKGR